MARMTNGDSTALAPVNLSGKSPTRKSNSGGFKLFSGRRKNGPMDYAIKAGIFAGAVFLAHYGTQAIDWVVAKFKLTGKTAGAIKALSGIGVYVGGLFLERHPLVKQYQIPTEAIGAVLGAPLVTDGWEDLSAEGASLPPAGGDAAGSTSAATHEGRKRIAGRILQMSGSIVGSNLRIPGGQSVSAAPAGAQVARGVFASTTRPFSRPFGAI